MSQGVEYDSRACRCEHCRGNSLTRTSHDDRLAPTLDSAGGLRLLAPARLGKQHAGIAVTGEPGRQHRCPRSITLAPWTSWDNKVQRDRRSPIIDACGAGG